MQSREVEADGPVVVTGAGGRLGSVLVRDLSRAGFRTAGIVASEEEGARAAGSCTVMHVAPPMDDVAVGTAMRRVAEVVGRPSALVHTVGMWDGRPILDTGLEEWRTILDVNLTSTFVVFREALRVMLPGPATLIAFASGQGADRGRTRQSAYSAAKAGVIRLVESVAEEYRDQDVWPVALAPSVIRFGEEKAGVEILGQGSLAPTWTGIATDIADNGTIVGFDTLMQSRLAWIQPTPTPSTSTGMSTGFVSVLMMIFVMAYFRWWYL